MTLKERDKNVIWHPYTPMKLLPEAIAIVKGEGALLIDEDGNEYIDVISSWWVNIHGHSHPYIAEKVFEQFNTIEHSIFAGFTHEPAIELAERLLSILPGEMSKVFYSDNGSTAVEVAIKMALQYWSNRGKKRTKIVALENAYHGDTFGAMSVSGRSIFTTSFEDKLFDVATIPFPFSDAENDSINKLKDVVSNGDVAAFIVEPLVQGAAGMQMYSSDVLEQFFTICKEHDVLIIADEVMTGFGRTNTLFACEQVSISADIMCFSKGLTGGSMPLGVTTCTNDIFQAFYSDDRNRTLYHGHSFTGNPISCAASLASMDLLLGDECKASRQSIITAHKKFADKVNDHKSISVIRQEGTILAVELSSDEDTYYNHSDRDFIYNFFIDRGVLIRPLGKIIYLIPPYCITQEQLFKVYNYIEELLNVWSTKKV